MKEARQEGFKDGEKSGKQKGREEVIKELLHDLKQHHKELLSLNITDCTQRIAVDGEIGGIEHAHVLIEMLKEKFAKKEAMK